MDIFGRPALAFIACLAIVLAGFTLTATDALWIQVSAALVAAIISLFWIRRAIPNHTGPVQTIPKTAWFSAALPLGAVDILRQLDGSYGIILIGWFASDIELGLFRVAVACVIVVAMPVTILHVILAPTVARLYNLAQTDELQRLLSWTSAALVVMVIPIAIASYFIGRPAIELVFGAAYRDSWLPLFLLCLAQLVFAFFGMGPILLAMCEGERELIKIYVVSVGLGMIAAAPLIAMFGASGAAVAQIVSFWSIGLLSRRHARKALGVDVTFLPLIQRIYDPPAR
jgi:O-antigen/teichoic acid export membrane protein